MSKPIEGRGSAHHGNHADPPQALVDAGDPPEPRWAVMIAVIATAGLYLAIPDSLAIAPRWLQMTVVGALVVPTMVSHHTGFRRLNELLGYATESVLTLFMAISVVLLIRALPGRKEDPVTLMRSALALWVSNVLVFSLWYWRLDGGGPYSRDKRAGHEHGAFLFPQMTLKGPLAREPDGRPWSPRYVDYLFLAFNTSTAFSPTDVPVLSRWAKMLTMTQASISLAVIVLLAARAVNIL